MPHSSRRLHHTETIKPDQLWRYARFQDNTGKQLGVKLNRRARGAASWKLFRPAVAMKAKIIV